MIQILISYNSMNIGGSTTSLIGFLNSLDYSKVNVDLQLYENVGPYFDLIPKEVHVLPEARKFAKNKIVGSIQRIMYPIYWKVAFKKKRLEKKYPNSLAGAQATAHARAKTSKKNEKKYDVAIGYLEMWPDYYVAYKVNAKKKMAWIHVDYEKAGLCMEAEDGVFSKFDKIVFVSDECVRNFCTNHPEYENRTCCIENILLKQVVTSRASCVENNIYKKGILNIVTVCRIQFSHKGLDRALNVLLNLKKQGRNFLWHVIGDGEDFIKMRELIQKYDMEKQVILYGAKENPLPLVKQMDVFLLPSKYEGKPMVITEAQMLEVPVIVTNYASAKEQVKSNYEGLIVDNSEDGIYAGLKYILDKPEILCEWKLNLKTKAWDYSHTKRKIETLILE